MSFTQIFFVILMLHYICFHIEFTVGALRKSHFVFWFLSFIYLFVKLHSSTDKQSRIYFSLVLSRFQETAVFVS